EAGALRGDGRLRQGRRGEEEQDQGGKDAAHPAEVGRPRRGESQAPAHSRVRCVARGRLGERVAPLAAAAQPSLLSSQPLSWPRGMAPTLVSSGLPSLNRIMVGMPRTEYSFGVIGLSSMLTFATVSLPA